MINDRRLNSDRRANPPATLLRPRDVLHALIAHPLRWAGPLVLCTIFALVYAMLKAPTWEATQALIVRDEAVGKSTRPGKFGAIEEMKTAQETVLEVIKSQSVLRGALEHVGPPAGQPVPEGWPSEGAIESLADAIKIVPPKGAEFGKTEVFYLKVQASDPARAIALAEAICRQLEAQFDDLRYQKYQGVIEELTKTVSLAEADLNAATAQLTAVEKSAGPDLAELRILNESPSNDSGLRRVSGEIETELRTYRASLASNQELLHLLEASLDDPGRLLASPGRLLESQPALRRLKDGLVDAQLRTAQLLGNMSDTHPAVVAAMASEQEISQHLHEEISIAIKGLQVDLRLSNERVDRLEEQRKNVQDRLIHLATIRARYSNLAASVRNRGETLKNAQSELADAHAAQAAAHTASLITLVGQANVGSRPAGPGKTMILLAGILGGLAIGAGIVFLTIEPVSATAYRAGDAVEPAPVQTVNVQTVHVHTGMNRGGPAEALARESVAAANALECSSAAPAAIDPPAAATPPPAQSPPVTPLDPEVATPKVAAARSGDAWPVEQPTLRETPAAEPARPLITPAPVKPAVAPAREKPAAPVATAPRASAPPKRSPVAAGSLSLREALDRVFPRPTAN